MECLLNHFRFTIKFVQNLTVDFLELLFLLTNFALTTFISVLQSLLYLREFSFGLLVQLSQLLGCKFVFEIKNLTTISVEVCLRLTHRVTHTTSHCGWSQKRISLVWICCGCLCKTFCSIPIILVNFLGALQFCFLHFLHQVFLYHVFTTNYSLICCLMLSKLNLFVFSFCFYSFNSLFFSIERLA